MLFCAEVRGVPRIVADTHEDFDLAQMSTIFTFGIDGTIDGHVENCICSKTYSANLVAHKLLQGKSPENRFVRKHLAGEQPFITTLGQPAKK